MILLNGKMNFHFKLTLTKHLLIFLGLNILLYVGILFFSNKVSFNYFNYEVNSHHFIEDHRIKGKPFNLINSLGQFDAQWYLKIATEGYPQRSVNTNLNDESSMSGLTYAFFPLYPILIGLVNLPFKDIELSAFVFSFTLIFVNFVSLFFIVKKHFDSVIALKTSYLLFFFPFAIFFRSYFTEGLYLFLLLWFSYFLFEKKYFTSSLFLSFLNITKASGFLLDAVFFYLAIREFRKHKINLRKLMLILATTFTPFVFWMIFNYKNTGSFIYFISARSYWASSAFLNLPILAVLHNAALLILFPFLPFHTFHTSKVDMLSVLLFLLLLIKSKKVLPKTYWLIALCLWLSPLLVTDTMSFSRYQSVNFPIFIYLAHILKGKSYVLVLILFLASLAVVSLFYVNWWWIG